MITYRECRHTKFQGCCKCGGFLLNIRGGWGEEKEKKRLKLKGGLVGVGQKNLIFIIKLDTTCTSANPLYASESNPRLKKSLV